MRVSVVAAGAALAMALATVPACAQEPAPTPAPTFPSAPSAAAPSARPSATVAPDPSACPETAAATHDWGAPTRSSDFTGTTLPPDWHPYGPEPGHQQRGLRTPAAITVADGEATMRGTGDGTTGAMSWHPGQRYGRWELCVKSDPGPLHAVALLWPVAEDWPVGGEVDWMEISDDSRQTTDFFLHYGRGNSQESGSVRTDATTWTAYALEWTPEKITVFVNGREWYSTTDTSHFPPRPMNMTIQLDYFGDGGDETAMHVDWAKQWALPESEPAELSLAPGDPATGQPELHPDRVPRTLTP